MIIQRCQVAAEIEGTEGTMEVIVVADMFMAFNPKFEPVITPHERNPVAASLSPYPSVFGSRSAKFSFDVELVGTAAAGSAIDYSDALRACGVSETLVAVTSATYKPASSGIPSVTLAMYLDGKIYRAWGARAESAKLVLQSGKAGILSLGFLCAEFSEADGVLLAPTYTAIKPPTFQSATLTIDGYAAIIDKLTLDFGIKTTLRKDANSASGHKSAVITDRQPKISFDPENVLVATEDFLGNWRSGASMAFTTTIGSVAGNTIAITAPAVQYQKVSMADREGISTLEAEGLCCINAGDDEWQIQIT